MFLDIGIIIRKPSIQWLWLLWLWSSQEVSATSWALGNWKCTADALYMHPLPAPSRTNLCTQTHTFTCRSTQRKDGRKSFHELCIEASKHKQWVLQKCGMNMRIKLTEIRSFLNRSLHSRMCYSYVISLKVFFTLLYVRGGVNALGCISSTIYTVSSCWLQANKLTKKKMLTKKKKPLFLCRLNQMLKWNATDLMMFP